MVFAACVNNCPDYRSPMAAVLLYPAVSFYLLDRPLIFMQFISHIIYEVSYVPDYLDKIFLTPFYDRNHYCCLPAQPLLIWGPFTHQFSVSHVGMVTATTPWSPSLSTCSCFHAFLSYFNFHSSTCSILTLTLALAELHGFVLKNLCPYHPLLCFQPRCHVGLSIICSVF